MDRVLKCTFCIWTWFWLNRLRFKTKWSIFMRIIVVQTANIISHWNRMDAWECKIANSVGCVCIQFKWWVLQVYPFYLHFFFVFVVVVVFLPFYKFKLVRTKNKTLILLSCSKTRKMHRSVAAIDANSAKMNGWPLLNTTRWCKTAQNVVHRPIHRTLG